MAVSTPHVQSLVPEPLFSERNHLPLTPSLTCGSGARKAHLKIGRHSVCVQASQKDTGANAEGGGADRKEEEKTPQICMDCKLWNKIKVH